MESQVTETAGQSQGMMPRGALQYHAGSLCSLTAANGWERLFLVWPEAVGPQP